MQYRPFRAAAVDCSACERSNAQTGTPFGAACPKHCPTPARAHANKKPVSTLPAYDRRVKSTFHLGGFLKRTITFKDRKSTRLNSSHSQISYAVFCLKKK